MITLNQIKLKLQNAIRDAVRYNGISQAEIARRIGVRPQTLSNYLNGKIMPAFDTFANLCKFLDLDPSEILCLNE